MIINVDCRRHAARSHGSGHMWRVRGRCRAAVYEVGTFQGRTAEEAKAAARRAEPCDGLRLEAILIR